MRLDLVNKIINPPSRPFHVAPAHELDHIRVYDAIPQRRAGAGVRDTSGQLWPQLAQQLAQPRLRGPDQTGDALAQASGERRALPRCRDGDGNVSLPMDRGRDEAAVVEIVDRVQEHALSLGLSPYCGIGRAIVGPRDGESGTSEITRSIRAAPQIDLSRCRELRQAGRGLGAHHGDVRAGREQAEHFLLGDRAAADHHGATAPEIEKHRVERHRLTGTEARCASMPTRWQKSPNRSSSSRSSR